MILNIWDKLNKIVAEIEEFIVSQYDNYFFWIILFASLLALGIYAISKFNDK